MDFAYRSTDYGDCKNTHELIEGIDAEYLLAYRGYDTDNVIEQADRAKMEAVIPSNKNRKIQRGYDKNIYENRCQVENRYRVFPQKLQKPMLQSLSLLFYSYLSKASLILVLMIILLLPAEIRASSFEIIFLYALILLITLKTIR